MTSTARVDVLTHAECVNLLRDTEIGRVVYTDRALPAVLPVAYLVDGDTLVVRTARGSRLANASDGEVLAFEADDARPATRQGWSVVVTGKAWIETDDDEVGRLDRVLRTWVPGSKDVFIRIPLNLVTGRRVVTGTEARAVS